MPACIEIEQRLLLNKSFLSDNLLRIYGLHAPLMNFNERCKPFSFNKIVAAPKLISTEELLRWRLFNWGCLNDVDPDDLFSDVSLGSSLISGQVSYVHELEFSTSPYPPIHWIQQASLLHPALDFVLAFTTSNGSNELSAKGGRLCLDSTLTQTKLRLERLV